VHHSGLGGAPAGGYSNHCGPSYHAGVQPLHRYSAAASLPSHSYAWYCYRGLVLPVDVTAVIPIRLLSYDTLPSVPIATM